MSTRTSLRPYLVITGGSMSGNITSDVTILQSITAISYALNWAGTSPVGTVSVQVSNDYSLDGSGQVLNTGTWTTLTLAYNGSATTTIPISGNTGNGFIDIEKTAAYAVRLIYTFTSGSGLLSATICGKVS